MQPYYEQNGITIYHADCREILPHIGSVDLVLTDPPYGTRKYETDVPFDTRLLRQWIASVRTVALFGYPELLASWCVDAGVKPGEWVVWWPTNKGIGRSNDLPKETEHIAIFGETPGSRLLFRPRIQDKTCLAITSARGLSADEARLGDVWRDPSPGMMFNSHLRLHPNEKPLSLMSRLIILCAGEDDLILDPFMGSGTTLRAAKDLGRRAIGIEIEERYCEIAAQRLSQEVMAF